MLRDTLVDLLFLREEELQACPAPCIAPHTSLSLSPCVCCDGLAGVVFQDEEAHIEGLLGLAETAADSLCATHILPLYVISAKSSLFAQVFAAYIV